jgi:hypothetical protein
MTELFFRETFFRVASMDFWLGYAEHFFQSELRQSGPSNFFERCVSLKSYIIS